MGPKAPSPTLAAAHSASAREASDAAAEPPPPLDVDIVEQGGDWTGVGCADPLIRSAVAALARCPDVADHLPASACIALATDAAVRDLNRTWRGQDKATNVLSFPAEGPARGALPSPFIGDVILADGVLAREAHEQGIQPAHHLQHLIVHGLLHLMGYDHTTDAQAQRMEGLETLILATLGIADPYASID